MLEAGWKSEKLISAGYKYNIVPEELGWDDEGTTLVVTIPARGWWGHTSLPSLSGNPQEGIANCKEDVYVLRQEGIEPDWVWF